MLEVDAGKQIGNPCRLCGIYTAKTNSDSCRQHAFELAFMCNISVILAIIVQSWSDAEQPKGLFCSTRNHQRNINEI